jgi:hypothetical protein
MVRLILPLCLLQLGAGQDPDVYVRPPTTLKGCKCKSECKTDILFHCNVAEFCMVESKDCAHGTADYSMSKFGHYDYCTYPAFKHYEQMSAQQKQALLLAKAGGSGSGSYPPTLNVLTGILGESVMTSFDSNSDTMAQKRSKYIHSVGIVGGIKFVSSGDHPYKGLFQGADHGIVRFSSAKEPSSDGFTPGMGLKFLRDGRKSANFVSMYSLDGHTCDVTNFFESAWSNHIPLTDNFGLKIIAAKFWQASYCPLMVGVSDMASDADGKPAPRGSFPFQLIFKPAVNTECHCDNYDKCLANLAKLPVGTKLFDVEALATPGAASKHIGEILMTSQITRSRWGDEQLFFQHQHMEDDFDIHPEWLEQLDLKKDCGMDCASNKRPTIDNGCHSPFSSNMTMLGTDTVV